MALPGQGQLLPLAKPILQPKSRRPMGSGAMSVSHSARPTIASPKSAVDAPPSTVSGSLFRAAVRNLTVARELVGHDFTGNANVNGTEVNVGVNDKRPINGNNGHAGGNGQANGSRIGITNSNVSHSIRDMPPSRSYVAGQPWWDFTVGDIVLLPGRRAHLIETLAPQSLMWTTSGRQPTSSDP